MRPLKFRAWNKKEKKMYPSYAHQGKNKRLYVAWLKDDSDYVDLELMQFTGLSDKNGKEVYEGDVCRFYPVKGEPILFHGLAYVDNKKVGGSWKIIRCDNEGGEDWGLDSSSFWNEDYEVIGTIYENPELLTTKSK